MFDSGISGIFGSSGARIPFNPMYNQKFNIHGYEAPEIEKVRVGVTGLGNRGPGSVQRLASLEGVEIKALNDLEPERVTRAKESIDSSIHNPAGHP